VKDYSTAKFKELVTSQMVHTAAKDKSLGDVFSRFWSMEFGMHLYHFERQAEKIKELKKVTLKQF